MSGVHSKQVIEESASITAHNSTKRGGEMRLFFLRLFISWWAIPLCLIFMFPFVFLVTGRSKSIQISKEFTKDLWYGIPNE